MVTNYTASVQVPGTSITIPDAIWTQVRDGSFTVILFGAFTFWLTKDYVEKVLNAHLEALRTLGKNSETNTETLEDIARDITQTNQTIVQNTQRIANIHRVLLNMSRHLERMNTDTSKSLARTIVDTLETEDNPNNDNL